MHIITHFFTLQSTYPLFVHITIISKSICLYLPIHLPIYQSIHIYIYTLRIYYVHQSINPSINPPINLSLSLSLSLALSLSLCISSPSRPSSKLSNASSSPPPSLRRCRSWHAAPHRINRCPTWRGFQWENHGTIKATSSINGPKKAGKINYRSKSSMFLEQSFIGNKSIFLGKSILRSMEHWPAASLF